MCFTPHRYNGKEREENKLLQHSNPNPTLVNDVELNQKMFCSLTAGGTTNIRKHSAWEKVTGAVQSVGSEERKRSEKKKKWFDVK